MSPLEAFASRWIVAVCAFVGLLIGLVLFTIRAPVYESQTIISVNNPIGTMGDEAALVLSDRVLGVATTSLGFAPELEVEANEIAKLLTITVRADDPEDASRAATQLAELYVQRQTTVAVRVADAAEPNPDPVAPNRLAYVLIGSVVGAIVGAGLSGLRGLGDRLPVRQAVPEERPAPIRPALQPSDLGQRLAEASSAAAAPPSQSGPVVDVRDHVEPTVDVRTLEPAPFSSGDASPVTIHTLDEVPSNPMAPPSDRRPTSPFSRASTSMVARPRRAEPTWRDGEQPATIADPELFRDETLPPDLDPGVPPTFADELPPIEPPQVPSTFTDSVPTERRSSATPQPTSPAHNPPVAPMATSEPSEPSHAVAPPQPVHVAPTELREHQTPVQAVEYETPAQPAEQVAPPRFVSPRETVTEQPTYEEDDDWFDPNPIVEHAAPVAAEPHAHVAAPTESPFEPVPVSTARIDEAVTAALEVAEARFEARLADQGMAHEQQLSSIEAHYERQVAELKREVAESRKRARTAAAQLKRMTGDDQHRIGDLEAQATALENEIASLRSQLESERIAHLRELTNERDAADRMLDNARRDFRDQIDAHDQTNRTAMARHRSEIDEAMAETRADHEAALERQHREYESTLAAERNRRRDDLQKLAQRHRDEVETLTSRHEQAQTELKRRTKQTLAELRASEKRLSSEVDDLRQAERQFRNELTLVRTSLREAEQKHTETEQTLRDELALTKKALQSEKDRNAALREDVVRRTAEAHQAVDRAIEDRSTKLAELETLVTRQREQAEARIREANQAAEERIREATQREADLVAQVSRLERQLDEAQRRPQSGSQTG